MEENKTMKEKFERKNNRKDRTTNKRMKERIVIKRNKRQDRQNKKIAKVKKIQNANKMANK